LCFLLEKNKNIFLKMDIEGSEYKWLLSDRVNLNNIKQMVIEFHGINDNSWGCEHSKKIESLDKISKTHYLIHSHGNNYSSTTNKVPDVIELTYVNKNYFESIPDFNTQELPIPNLDYPNKPNTKDYKLNFYPFVKS
jgi:hypothetical protein